VGTEYIDKNLVGPKAAMFTRHPDQLCLIVAASPFDFQEKWVAAVRRLEIRERATRQTRMSPAHNRHNRVHTMKVRKHTL
jgi:hypothetical protein